ncbi:MAG: helix-turn-helix transcriptional regulator, partial [Acetobacteraceae bacterium]|nr:helix-turn-helix transcriptional regulator [Acetobacteraceae bacterium]
MLAHYDHEQVSVARLAREAGISVGAFYQRFPDKDAFLDMVVAQRLRRATEQAREQLDPKRWQRSSASAVARAIVEEMMRTFHGPSAGVVRTALKGGHLDREKLEPLLE